MKLRLIAKGWETYTGQMGVINFVNGVSVGDVLELDAVRVAGVIGAEWEDGTAANVGQRYIDNLNTPAPSVKSAPVKEPKQGKEPAKNGEAPKVEAPKPAVVAIPVEAIKETKYTAEQLAKIADAQGIAGLREIATPLGIKGNSISALMIAILKKTGK
jgi:hypothetical protein